MAALSQRGALPAYNLSCFSGGDDRRQASSHLSFRRLPHAVAQQTDTWPLLRRCVHTVDTRRYAHRWHRGAEDHGRGPEGLGRESVRLDLTPSLQRSFCVICIAQGSFTQGSPEPCDVKSIGRVDQSKEHIQAHPSTAVGPSGGGAWVMYGRALVRRPATTSSSGRAKYVCIYVRIFHPTPLSSKAGWQWRTTLPPHCYRYIELCCRIAVGRPVVLTYIHTCTRWHAYLGHLPISYVHLW